MSRIRIRNSEAAYYVTKFVDFQGSNLYSTHTDHGYVVYSYGPHWPLLVAVYCGGRLLWFANADKYSRSTSRHLKQALPIGEKVTWLTCDQMHTLVNEGYKALVQQRLG